MSEIEGIRREQRGHFMSMYQLVNRMIVAAPAAAK
jgi:hypothetical protein